MTEMGITADLGEISLRPDIFRVDRTKFGQKDLITLVKIDKDREGMKVIQDRR